MNAIKEPIIRQQPPVNKTEGCCFMVDSVLTGVIIELLFRSFFTQISTLLSAFR